MLHRWAATAPSVSSNSPAIRRPRVAIAGSAMDDFRRTTTRRHQRRSAAAHTTTTRRRRIVHLRPAARRVHDVSGRLARSVPGRGAVVHLALARRSAGCQRCGGRGDNKIFVELFHDRHLSVIYMWRIRDAKRQCSSISRDGHHREAPQPTLSLRRIKPRASRQTAHQSRRSPVRCATASL